VARDPRGSRTGSQGACQEPGEERRRYFFYICVDFAVAAAVGKNDHRRLYGYPFENQTILCDAVITQRATHHPRADKKTPPNQVGGVEEGFQEGIRKPPRLGKGRAEQVTGIRGFDPAL